MRTAVNCVRQAIAQHLMTRCPDRSDAVMIQLDCCHASAQRFDQRHHTLWRHGVRHNPYAQLSLRRSRRCTAKDRGSDLAKTSWFLFRHYCLHVVAFRFYNHTAAQVQAFSRHDVVMPVVSFLAFTMLTGSQTCLRMGWSHQSDILASMSARRA